MFAIRHTVPACYLLVDGVVPTGGVETVIATPSATQSGLACRSIVATVNATQALTIGPLAAIQSDAADIVTGA